MRSIFGLLLVSIVTLFSTSARAADDIMLPALKIGDPAPAITVGEWYKGEPVKSLEKDKIYVLEFWATWCGPCVKAMPKLSKIQAEYSDQNVIVIGVNVAEDGEADVAEFVNKQGKKMAYRVVADDTSKSEAGLMTENWLEAAGQEGIPTTFVIDKTGTVAWIGHPDELSDVLKAVVSDKWDVKKAREDFIAGIKKQQQLLEIQERLQVAVDDKDVDKVLAIVDEMVKIEPEAEKEVPLIKFTLLLGMDEYKRAYEMNNLLFDKYKDESQALNEISWTILDNEELAERDFDMAMKFAVRANEVTKGEDPEILDTLARAHFEKDDLEKAIELQTKAVEKAADDKQLKRELERTLKKYKAKKAV